MIPALLTSKRLRRKENPTNFAYLSKFDSANSHEGKESPMLIEISSVELMSTF